MGELANPHLARQLAHAHLFCSFSSIIEENIAGDGGHIRGSRECEGGDNDA